MKTPVLSEYAPGGWHSQPKREGAGQGAAAPAMAPGTKSPAAVAAACLSRTFESTDGKDREVRAKTLEIISESIRALIEAGWWSCLWVTITFPPEAKGRKERQRRFDSFRVNYLNKKGKSVWVVEPHASGEIHFHGVWLVPGANFAEGFNYGARKRWQWSRSEFDKVMWLRSASPDLQAMWKQRRIWKRSYGLGHVDIVPLSPATVPQAVARYVASYASQSAHPKGTRLVRVVGYRKGETRPAVTNRRVYPDAPGTPPEERQFPGLPQNIAKKGKVVSCFSLIGERCTILGKLKMAGDTGERNRGWALRAAIRGAGRICWATFPHLYQDTKAIVTRCLRALQKPSRRERWWDVKGFTEAWLHGWEPSMA